MYELSKVAKGHETPFHDNPNYITTYWRNLRIYSKILLSYMEGI